MSISASLCSSSASFGCSRVSSILRDVRTQQQQQMRRHMAIVREMCFPIYSWKNFFSSLSNEHVLPAGLADCMCRRDTCLPGRSLLLALCWTDGCWFGAGRSLLLALCWTDGGWFGAGAPCVSTNSTSFCKPSLVPLLEMFPSMCDQLMCCRAASVPLIEKFFTVCDKLWPVSNTIDESWVLMEVPQKL